MDPRSWQALQPAGFVSTACTAANDREATGTATVIVSVSTAAPVPLSTDS